MGYVLPWGQLSFWGGTVITNLASAIPLLGEPIVHWLCVGFSVDNATLNRFFSLHYLLPFLIAAVVVIHMAAVHIDGSNNPLGIASHIDKISFFPYFFIKDSHVYSNKRTVFLNPDQESQTKVAFCDVELNNEQNITLNYLSVKEN